MNKMMYIIVAFILVLAACGTNGEEQEQDNAHELGTTDEVSYTVKDARGVDLTFEEPPETIISILPSNTEIVFELGQGEKVIGVSDTDVYPEAVQNIEVVAEYQNINVERMLELDPDIIFGFDYGNDEMAPLEEVGLPVYAIDGASSMEDIFSDIQGIADALAISEDGEALVTDMQDELEEIADTVAEVDERSIYFEISPSPDIWTLGTGTFQHEMIEAAGLHNVFDDVENWFGVSDEQVIERNPELIFTTVHYTDGDPLEEIRNRAGWESIDAIVNNELELMPPDIMDRPGPRIVEAVRTLAETAYPNLF
ncbi:ABC transporter substrate-binding protein [Shouchella patagoniensis]|uniref:ABC transporter substrate-binding protein n=1 Tax=Shouchella patagoniensis TaxID=228576 RepID=UPI0009958A12|nr:ABC transporter substrate-binding protein [Shouchella patagoniensis]